MKRATSCAASLSRSYNGVCVLGRGEGLICHSSFSCLGHSMAMECVMHGCDVMNKRGCACQTEHTLVYSYRSVLG